MRIQAKMPENRKCADILSVLWVSFGGFINVHAKGLSCFNAS